MPRLTYTHKARLHELGLVIDRWEKNAYFGTRHSTVAQFNGWLVRRYGNTIAVIRAPTCQCELGYVDNWPGPITYETMDDLIDAIIAHTCALRMEGRYT